MVDPTVELEATKTALQALKPLDPEQAGRALRWLAEVLEVPLQTRSAVEHLPASATPAAGPTGPSQQPTEGQQGSTRRTPQSAEEFLAHKRPKSGAEKIARLGFYLSEYRGTQHFKTPDIVALNMEAAQPKIANPSRDVDNAERGSGYLTSAGGGNKQCQYGERHSSEHCLTERPWTGL